MLLKTIALTAVVIAGVVAAAGLANIVMHNKMRSTTYSAITHVGVNGSAAKGAGGGSSTAAAGGVSGAGAGTASPTIHDDVQIPAGPAGDGRSLGQGRGISPQDKSQ